MKKIISTFKYFYRILSSRRKIQSQLLLIFSLLNGFLETLSVGLILVYGNIILFPEKLELAVKNFSNYFNLNFTINNETFLFSMTLLFIFVSIIAAVLRIVFAYFQAKVVNNFFYDLNSLFYSSILKKNYKDLSYFNPNEILSILGKIDTTIYSFKSAINLIANIIIFLFIFLAISFVNFKLILISSIFLILFYLTVIKSTKKKVNEIGKIESFYQGKTLDLINISIKSFKEIILYNAKKYFENQFLKIIRKVSDIRVISSIIGDAPRNIIVPFILVTLIIFTYNYSKFNDLNILLPEIAALIFAIQRIIPCINVIFNSFLSIVSSFQTNSDVLNFISESKIYESKIEKKDFNKNLENQINFKNFIEVKNLSFEYKINNQIFSSLNLKINKGEKIAITGANGSGKSTLINILMGFAQEYKGSIMIDGITLDKKYLKHWQSKISYVPQKIFLFDDTIKNNIILGQDITYFDKEKFNKATFISKVNEFVEKENEKYDTVVKDEGTRFSGGQIQRISLARALYFSKEILILDEFTSQIDKESELQIVKDLFLGYKSSTIILITHNDEIRNLCREINLSKI
jgi:ABC-type bacteriocin/lantibiotic exporter with double-glycine peptidase domain